MNFSNPSLRRCQGPDVGVRFLGIQNHHLVRAASVEGSEPPGYEYSGDELDDQNH